MNRYRSTLALLAVVVLAGCGGGSQVETPLVQGAGAGNVFVIGTDAPLASVVAFRVTFTGLTISDGVNTVSLLSQPQEIEFARLNGLRNLLNLQSAPVGAYSSVTATLATPVIHFLDTSVAPPAVSTLDGTLTQSGVTVTLNQPLVVTDGGLVGLLVDFRLAESLLRDAGGQITGQVNPVLVVRAIPPDAPEAMIDELRGGVVSVDAAAGTFVIQGPMGRSFTVETNAQTVFEDGESLATLTSNSIVQVTGSLQRQTLRLRATEVVVVSNTRFLAGGLITDVRPSNGPADAVDVLVRSEIPDLAAVQVGGISTFAIDGNERFLIHTLRFPVGSLLFNRGSMIAGQRVSIGGSLDGSNVDVRRVVLHRQGLDGLWIPGSTNIASGNSGVFGFNAAGVLGVLFERPVRVLTSERTRWIGLSGLSALAGADPMRLRVVGLVLKDQANGEQVVIAMAVERLQP
ncbi:MAG TPA: DUF5666 domain-containing protein [Candidatus Acidoferrales bacterium]